jgi:hypothetical protein
MANVWYQWCTDSAACTSGGGYVTVEAVADTSTVSVIWRQWNAGSSSCSDTTWSAWCQASTSGSTVPVTYRVAAVQAQPRQPTAEEVAQAAEQARLAQEARRAAEEARKAAVAKAVALLREHLDESQRQEFERDRHFHVISQSGKRYRLRVGRSGNVFELDEQGREVNRYCIHPGEWVPDEDTMLAQKLLLETDEGEFRRLANKTRLAV